MKHFGCEIKVEIGSVGIIKYYKENFGGRRDKETKETVRKRIRDPWGPIFKRLFL